jgi:hypothetical protein
MPKYHPQKQGGWRWMEIASVDTQPCGYAPTAATTSADAYYCNSLVTACCVLLAWARALMPVWVRIWYFDSSDVALV